MLIENTQGAANKFAALLNCTPEQCRKCGCLLYYEEKQCCDAQRFLDSLAAAVSSKITTVKIYDPWQEEAVSSTVSDEPAAESKEEPKTEPEEEPNKTDSSENTGKTC